MIMMRLIKLLLLTIVLIAFINSANATSIREEDIWIFQGSYELGIGERAYLEGFTVKLNDISNGTVPTATLLIYSNSVYMEAFEVDAGVNNEHIYDGELKINVVSIENNRISLNIYKHKSELVWVTDIPKTAFKAGDSLSGNDYRITLKAINGSTADLVVRVGEEEYQRTYNSGDYEKFSEDFMINIVYINMDTQEVFIETLKPGAPQIRIDVGNLQESYEPNDYVEYELVVTNNGTIPLHGIILTTECDDGEVELVTQQHSILDPQKKKKFQIRIKPYIEPVTRNITITTSVEGYDYRGNKYNNQIKTEATVNSYISIEKKVTSKEKTSDNPEFGTEQYFQINITVSNKADFQTAVTVTDVLPPEFIPTDIENTEWSMVLAAGETKTIGYFASSTEPGNFTIEPATVAWKDSGETYTMQSNPIEETFHVSGSRVILQKEISSSYMVVGETIDVILKITNEGDRDMDISFRETIPDELSYVVGEREWHGTLAAGTTKEFRYTVKAERAGEYYLPETELCLTDENGKKENMVSDELFLYIDDAPTEVDDQYYEQTYNQLDASASYPSDTSVADPDITSIEVMKFLVSSFASLLALIAIVPTFAYLFISRVYKCI
jgi:Translocon-associated protein beta (TRAPB).